MITISLCMIVKNEAKILERCLDSLRGLMDEIIIVDTGSTDETKAIASKYTPNVYDFVWVQDFSAARNFAFSKATGDYIYSADADEILDQKNRERFLILKKFMMTDIDIVQMYYVNQLQNGTVYNFDRELRPKLFKRLRTFQWIEPVHETVRTLPVVYDSDVEIIHMPESIHAERDLQMFHRMVRSGSELSDRLLNFYARELFLCGNAEDFRIAERYFQVLADQENTSPEHMKTAMCIVIRAAKERGDYLRMYQYAIKDVACEAASEVCCILGDFYFERRQYKEAVLWYYNAAYEQHSILDIQYEKKFPLRGLIQCYQALGMPEMVLKYQEELKDELGTERT